MSFMLAVITEIAAPNQQFQIAFQLLRLAPWGLMRNGVAAFNGILVGTVISSLYPGVYGVDRSLTMWLFIVFGSLAR